MSKPKLDAVAMAEELGAVASFALRPPQSNNSPTPSQADPVERVEVISEEPKFEQSSALPNVEITSNDRLDETTQGAPSTNASSHGLSPARTGVRRTITRYSFEFYQDQVERLQRFALDEKIRGEKGSMSEMVREAIDAYLAKRYRLDE